MNPLDKAKKIVKDHENSTELTWEGDDGEFTVVLGRGSEDIAELSYTPGERTFFLVNSSVPSFYKPAYEELSALANELFASLL
jgi:hypothetical protein